MRTSDVQKGLAQLCEDFFSVHGPKLACSIGSEQVLGLREPERIKLGVWLFQAGQELFGQCRRLARGKKGPGALSPLGGWRDALHVSEPGFQSCKAIASTSSLRTIAIR